MSGAADQVTGRWKRRWVGRGGAERLSHSPQTAPRPWDPQHEKQPQPQPPFLAPPPRDRPLRHPSRASPWHRYPRPLRLNIS
eukprot:SAG25_NODE_1536_length_2829_cov_5.146520_2_plen_82_part_00